MASNHSAGSPRRALVTGASSGIGAAFASRLAYDGYDLVLVARRRDRLDQLADQLRQAAGVHAEALPADLSDPDDLRRVESRITRGDPFDLLVNNAGFGVYRPVAESDPGTLEEMILVNVLALTRLTRAALPGMLARGSGAVINVASGLAFIPSATRATYSGTKAYVINFTRALHQEVRDRGIQVQALCPGITDTEFHQRSGTDVSRIPPGMMMSADDVVDASLAGLILGELICIPALADTAYLDRLAEAQDSLTRNRTSDGRPASRYRAP